MADYVMFTTERALGLYAGAVRDALDHSRLTLTSEADGDTTRVRVTMSMPMDGIDRAARAIARSGEVFAVKPAPEARP